MILCEINGIQVAPKDLSSEEERARLAAAVAQAGQRVRALFDDDEWKQIQVRLVGSSLDDLTMKVSGPDYLVERVYESGA